MYSTSSRLATLDGVTSHGQCGVEYYVLLFNLINVKTIGVRSKGTLTNHYWRGGGQFRFCAK